MISDVLPTIVIYLNRKFELDLEKAIKAVKKSDVLKACKDDDNNISVQEWLGKFLNEVGVDIDSNKDEVINKIEGFIK